jgi:hypothetical protein
VNISARDDAALARRRYVENNKVDFPHLQEGRDNHVCSGTYLDFDFKLIISKLIKCTLKRLYCFYKSIALSKIKMTDIFLDKS